MKLAWPEIQRRSVSGWGNITGIGSDSGACGDECDDSGASWARTAGAISRTKPSSGTASLRLRCNSICRMMIIGPRTICETPPTHATIRSRSYGEMNNIPAATMLTTLNLLNKLCLTYSRMSIPFLIGGPQGLAPNLMRLMKLARLAL
jgi:hypothetical protein